jgi:hypothetical protein
MGWRVSLFLKGRCLGPFPPATLHNTCVLGAGLCSAVGEIRHDILLCGSTFRAAANRVTLLSLAAITPQLLFGGVGGVVDVVELHHK